MPITLRGLCDYVLSGEANTYDVAYALASLIDVVEHVKDAATKPVQKTH